MSVIGADGKREILSVEEVKHCDDAMLLQAELVCGGG